MSIAGSSACAERRVRDDSARSVLASLGHWARSAPGSMAVCVHDERGEVWRSWTYGQLAEAVGAAGEALQRWCGSEASVALKAPSGGEYLAWLLGGLCAGVRVCVVAPTATRHELERVVRITGARHMIAAERLAGLTDLTHIPLQVPENRGTSDISSFASCAQGSVVLQSSGTGGTPKLARRSMASLDADARGLAMAAELRPPDRVLGVVPLSHSYGVDLVVATILSGASLQVFERFEPAGVERLLRRGGVSVLPGVPFIFESLARSGPTDASHGLRLAISAGSPLPERIANEFHCAWGVRVGQLYGATELGTVTLGCPEHPDFDPRSVGLPVDGASVRVVVPGEPSKLVPTGEEGELAVRARSMLVEYLDGPTPLVDGHLLTGDLGRVDARGRVYVTGRLKHLIDIGGLKVNPVEVEEVLAGCPGIAECALVAIPVSETVTRLRLLYVEDGDSAVSADTLRVFAQARLSPHKLPRVYQRVAALPRTPGGKHLRSTLGEL